MAIPALLQFAEYSNMTSIVVVLVGLVITTLFIYFFRVTDFSHRSISIFGLKQRNMVKVQNPFVLSLQGDNNTLCDDLKLSLSALCPSTVVVLWGPKINPLHDFILLPGSDVRSKCLQSDGNLEGMEPLHMDILNYPDPGKHKIVLPCPENVSSSSLGDMPRQRYPLTVFVFISRKHIAETNATCSLSSGDPPNSGDRSAEENGIDAEGLEFESIEQPNSIIGLISIIHLKDEVVTQPSYVIAQYVKTAGIAIYSLQPLFMSSSHPDGGTEAPTATTSGEGGATSLSQSQNDTTASFSSQRINPTSDNPQTDSAAKDTQPFNQTPDNVLNTERFPKEHSAENDKELLSNRSHTRASNCDNESSPISFLSEDKNIRHRVLTQNKQRENEADRDRADQATAIPSNERLFQSYRDDFSSTPSSPEFEAEGGEPNADNLSDCVVCQSKPVMCVILPCRHTSVCFRCLKHLDRCPMCRGSIDSYFMLNKDGFEDDLDSDSEEDELLDGMQHEAVAGNVTMMLERLNAMLGFR